MQPMQPMMMKIGELARSTGTPVETIRFYERAGLLPAAPRSEGNYRLYGLPHAERLRFIRQCRGLDMSLDEVRALLRLQDTPEADCGQVNLLIDEHIAQVSARIAELSRLERTLQALRTRCSTPGEAAHCGILGALQSPRGAATQLPDPGPGGAVDPEAKPAAQPGSARPVLRPP